MSGSKIRQLGLGTDMRELRLRSGMSTRAVAGRLGVSRMAVHRTESGKRTVPADEVIAMCALYGVTGGDRERLVERATRGDNDASWLAAGPAFSDQFRSFVALEKQATRFTHVSMLIVPGLMQTPDYVRALVDSTDRDTEVISASSCCWVFEVGQGECGLDDAAGFAGAGGDAAQGAPTLGE